jgi:NTE family protein
MAMDKFSIFDFDKSQQIVDYGYREMNRMLDQHEMHI